MGLKKGAIGFSVKPLLSAGAFLPCGCRRWAGCPLPGEESAVDDYDAARKIKEFARDLVAAME